MKNIFFIINVFFLFSCNKIENTNTLDKSDIKYINELGLLNQGENINKFYSEFKTRNAGNFFTNKRIATYWIDPRNSKKNQKSFAFYSDIISIDTVYNAGTTYSPYMLVTKNNGESFKVSVNGSKMEIKSFFDDALNLWKAAPSNSK